ncbi:(2Fe-2S) ferredoxin domain-containing protein [Anabaena sp. FACHB-1237]|uniref:(2Fe-2S) ferredoxin domain-containing protein n=1 Tax=Anabaena sp. FACHB-1237 TaxID=2692769 RepID=UPI0016811018|nr:(2Fe-2S) ferredoxin domain-containing protein [Anabaena sp. FACHB-1237]MBD2136332.1 (2Fe-2S) ferredoxin domain-containing protein [Anabaena sp. FACHB-1237]
MSISTSLNVSKFCLEGRFLDFVIKDGNRLKGLILNTSDGEYYIKLAKNLRVAFNLSLPRGTWLQVVGSKKYDVKKGKFTFKAELVMTGGHREYGIKQQQENKNQIIKKQTILYCQKSDCMKRGGKMMCEILVKELSDRNLQDTVVIKGTGCMKNCQAGPNLIMPDKTHYTKVKSAQLPILVDKHFGKDVEIESKYKVKVLQRIPST